MNVRLKLAGGVSAFALLVAGVGSCKKLSADTTHPEKLPQPSRELEIPTQGYLTTLDNGLTLFVVPDPYTRLVQFDVRHQVGSREDPKGKEGMAHFVEHLMFQMPVEGDDSPKVMSHLPQHSLFFNAYTAADQTHYIHTGTSDELEQYMKYTALRLGYDCESVPEAEFMRERDVVRNEHRLRGQGIELFVFEAVNAAIFPEGHPYRRSPLAGDEAVASITPEDACDFIRRYYTPGQASVVVSGDVDPVEVLALAKKYLGELPKVDVPPRPSVPEPTFDKKQVAIPAPVKKPTAVVVFKMPKRFTKDYMASQAAVQTMFMSVGFFTSRQGSVLENWYPAVFGGEGAQVFGIAVETEKARDLDRAIDEVLDAITRGFGAAIEGDEYKGSYDSVRQRTRLQVLAAVTGVVGRGDAYAEYLEEGPNPGLLGADLAELDDLTAEHAHSVGRRLFARNDAMVIKVVPDGTQEAPKADRADFDYEPNEEESLSVPADIDPAEAHEPLRLQDIAPAQSQTMEYELESGMKVVLVQSSQIPVMDIQLIVKGGTADAGQIGDVADMAHRFYAPMQDREAQSLMNYFDMAGGIFNARSSAHSTTFTTRGLAIYLDFLIAGLSERVLQSEYRTGAVENWKQGQKERFKKHSARAAALRHNEFFSALYGPGHPHVRPVVIEDDVLRKVNIKDLESFRDTHYRAANSALIVTGGFDMNLVIQYVDAFFDKPKLRVRGSKWLEPKATAERTPAPPPKPGDVRYITQIDKEKVMTDLTIGYPLAEAFGDDHAALWVLADMLNFGVGSVRQKLGASYGIYARLDTGRPRIEVGGAVDGARAGEAYDAIRGAIEQVRTGEDFDRLFAFSRRNVLRNMVNAQADPELLAGRLAQTIQYGLSYDYYTELARNVANLKPEQVKAVIDRVLRDEKSVTMFVGDQAGIDNVILQAKIVGAKTLPEVIHDED